MNCNVAGQAVEGSSTPLGLQLEPATMFTLTTTTPLSIQPAWLIIVSCSVSIIADVMSEKKVLLLLLGGLIVLS